MAPAHLILSKTATSRWSCSSWVRPYTSRSSIKQTTPSSPAMTSDICFWKYSGAEVIPNGSLLKQNLPNGVMNVVRMADSSESRICQNPELASSFEKTLAPVSWAKICSTEGRMRRSLWTHSFSFVRSTQIRTFPFGFGTTTIPAHQSVGLSTLVMTPNCSMRCNSACTLGSNGSATLLGVERANGLASCLCLMWYSPFSVPRPLKSSGYLAMRFS